MFLGVFVGSYFPVFGVGLKPLGDGFIKLIKMVVAPIIFTTVVVGMAGIGSFKRVGRVGAKALLYFEIMTTLALVIGYVVVKWLKPGVGVRNDHQTSTARRVGAIAYTTASFGTKSITAQLVLMACVYTTLCCSAGC